MKLRYVFFAILIFTITPPSFVYSNDITIATVLDNPDKYDGNYIIVTGIPYGSYDGAYLHDGKGNTLFLGMRHCDAERKNIIESYGSWSLIKGTFRKATNASPGFFSFMDRIAVSGMEPINDDEPPNRIGYKLQAIMEVDGDLIAMLTDFRSGMGYQVKTGDRLRALYKQRIVSILFDRIIVEEECPECKTNNNCSFEVLLKPNQTPSLDK